MPLEIQQPPPPVELSIPREHRTRFLELQAQADRCWAVLEFRKNRAAKRLGNGWFLFRALRAHRDALEAMRAYRQSSIALWDCIHQALPDTMVGNWNLDSVRMLATRQAPMTLQSMLGGFSP